MQQNVFSTKGGLGYLLRQARLARHWRQVDLAEAAGISQRYVTEIETGKVSVSLDRLLLLARILDLELSVVDKKSS